MNASAIVLSFGWALGFVFFAAVTIASHGLERGRARRRLLERLEPGHEVARALAARVPVHCCRCGGPIAAGDLLVSGPPVREGSQLAHLDCPLTPTRPKGLPGDKRWTEGYHRDRERLRALFSASPERTPGGSHGLERDHPRPI